MEEEIDQHHIDGTSPMMETVVDGSPEGCLASAALMALSLSLPSAMGDPESPSFSRDVVHCRPNSSALVTSTPNPIPSRPRNLPSRLLDVQETSDSHRGSGCSTDSLGVGTCVSVAVEEPIAEVENLRAPIVGYEIMEQRAKFTVFKIHVRKSDQENWLLFRRYTDFVRVNDKLKQIFPIFRLSLPPKRWFGSNFDTNFLEDRQLGLQAFLDNIIGHKDIVLSGPVRDFLCLDDPPGPHDNIEESRALCESLDETVYNLRIELGERDRKIASLNAQLEAAHERINHLLHCQLPNGGGMGKAENTHNSSTPVSGENSTIEGDLHSQAEADQSLSLEQSETHHNSPEALVEKGLLSTDDAPSEPCSTPSEETGFQQGLARQEEDSRHNTQPNVITVT